MSSGLLGVIREALSWVVGAAMLALLITHFDEVRAFNRQLLGIEIETAGGDSAGLHHVTPRPGETSPRTNANGGVELRSDRDGHFNAEAEINGRNVSLLVDTGASLVVLTYEDAERAGLFVSEGDFTARARTANGIARNALVTLDEVCVESLCVRDVKAMVAEPGRLHVSLLGMTYLGRLRRLDMQPGRLVLED